MIEIWIPFVRRACTTLILNNNLHQLLGLARRKFPPSVRITHSVTCPLKNVSRHRPILKFLAIASIFDINCPAWHVASYLSESSNCGTRCCPKRFLPRMKSTSFGLMAFGTSFWFIRMANVMLPIHPMIHKYVHFYGCRRVSTFFKPSNHPIQVSILTIISVHGCDFQR